MIGKRKHLEHLQTLLKFTDDDLDANRAGYLGPSQRARIRQWDYWVKVGLSVVGAVLLLIFTLMQVVWWIKALIILIGVACIWASQREIRRFWTMYNSYMREPTVEAVEGVITLDISGSDSPSFKIKIGEKEFKVSKDVFLGFKNHEPYCLYYIPTINQLVAAEHLHDDYFVPDSNRLADEADYPADEVEESAPRRQRRNRP